MGVISRIRQRRKQRRESKAKALTGGGTGATTGTAIATGQEAGGMSSSGSGVPSGGSGGSGGGSSQQLMTTQQGVASTGQFISTPSGQLTTQQMAFSRQQRQQQIQTPQSITRRTEFFGRRQVQIPTDFAERTRRERKRILREQGVGKAEASLRARGLSIRGEKLTTTPKGEIKRPLSISGIASAGVILPAQFVTEGLKDIGVNLPGSDIKVAGGQRAVATTLTFGAVGGLTATTGQVTKTFPKITRVKFQGLEQTVKEGRTVTGLKFRTSAGEFGRAVGVSERVGTTPFFKTVVKGDVKSKLRLDLITGKLKPKITEQFKGVSLGTSKPATLKLPAGEGIKVGIKGFQEATIGVVKRGKLKPQRFVGIGARVTKGELTASVGATTTPKGDIGSVGVLRKIISQPKSFNVIGKGTGAVGRLTPSAKLVSPGAVGRLTPSAKLVSPTEKLATESIVRGALAQAPKTTTKVIPAVPIVAGISQLKTIVKVKPKQIQKPQTIQLSKQIQKPVVQIKFIHTQKQPQIPKIKTPEIIIVPPIKITQPIRHTTPIKITPRITNTPRIIIPKFKPIKLTKQPKGLFPVLVRRFGKFKTVGFGKTQQQAISIGRRKVGKTLAATFTVKGLGKQSLKLPGFRTKKSKEGLLFIEKRGRRLKKGSGEISEIQFFKKARPKSKKRK